MAGQLDVFLKGYEYLTRINIKNVFSNCINVMSCLQFLADRKLKNAERLLLPKYHFTDKCMGLFCEVRQLPKKLLHIMFDEQRFLCLWKKKNLQRKLHITVNIAP